MYSRRETETGIILLFYYHKKTNASIQSVNYGINRHKPACLKH
jgi:quinol-cytochrome oxidoreductase complex cytochrome b subunit